MVVKTEANDDFRFPHQVKGWRLIGSIGRQAGRQAIRQADRQAIRQADWQASKRIGIYRH